MKKLQKGWSLPTPAARRRPVRARNAPRKKPLPFGGNWTATVFVVASITVMP
jgi:hypothetical protein